MTGNQNKIIRTLKWILYPVILLLIIDFILNFFTHSPLEVNKKSNQVINWIDKGIMIVVFAAVVFVVAALMQQFFSKGKIKTKNTRNAANAKLILKIEAANQTAGSAILLVVALGFSVLLNILLFSPQSLLEQSELERFGLTGKIAHFLVIVFGQRLLKGMPPVFVATEKGFCYEPAGISTGWILWEDIREVRESAVLYGSGVNNGPTLMPVLGIKLINPDEYNAAAYAPFLQRVVNLGQKLNNYQTEGVGDILLRPSDFGRQYESVLALFKQKSNSTFDYYNAD
jgi:hypothetical protein